MLLSSDKKDSDSTDKKKRFLSEKNDSTLTPDH